MPPVAQLGSISWASSAAASGAAGRRRVPASLPDLGEVEQLFPYGNFYAGLQDRAWSSRRATSPTWPRCGVPLPRRQAAGPLQHLDIGVGALLVLGVVVRETSFAPLIHGRLESLIRRAKVDRIRSSLLFTASPVMFLSPAMVEDGGVGLSDKLVLKLGH